MPLPCEQPSHGFFCAIEDRKFRVKLRLRTPGWRRDSANRIEVRERTLCPMKKTFLLPFLLALVAVSAFLTSRRARVEAPRATLALTQQVYVWQRAWTGEVRDAIGGAGKEFSRMVVLGAEVSFSSGKWRVARAQVDWNQLAKGNSPVGIALRVGPYRGAFAEADDTTNRLIELADSLVGDAKKAGVALAEIQ